MGAHRLELHLNATTVEARLCSGNTVVWAATASFGSLPELQDAIAELGQALDGRARNAEAVLLVHPPWVQVREIDGLPRVSSRRLGLLIALQPLRYFRKTPGTLCTTAAWAEMPCEGTAKEPRALAGALNSECAEAAMAGAAEAGIRLHRIQSGEHPALSFLPHTLASRLRAAHRRAAIRAAQLSVVCCVIAAATVAADRARSDREVEASVARILPAAMAASEARERVAIGAEQLDSIAASTARRSRAALALIAAVSALGDSSHLTELVWRADGSGAMSGAAVRAAEVVDRLSRQNDVASAQLVSVSERIASPYGSREAFRIEFATSGAGG